MNQATPAHQELLWNLGECREDTNLDCHFRLCPCSHLEKAAPFTGQSLHNFTDAEYHSFPKERRLFSYLQITHTNAKMLQFVTT